MREMKTVGPGKFSWRELFSEAFSRHTGEELERHWAAGTIGNIPTIDNVDANWPKPWVFVRVFGLTLLVYLIFLFCWNRFHATNLLPGLIMVGTAAIPLSVLVFFFEMNARRNVSMYLLGKMLILGGAVSLLFSLFMFRVTELAGLGWMGASVAGIAEETGKLLAVLAVANCLRYPYLLNGILFGAAVGTGFAVFESAGYALNSLILQIIDFSVSNSEKILGAAREAATSGSSGQDILSGLFRSMAAKFDDAMFGSITLRGCLSPFGHIIWTAMAAGGLWLVKGSRKFEFGMLLDSRFLRFFAAAMLFHAVWNSPWEPELVTPYDKQILLGVVGWAIVFCLIRRGLVQLAEEKARCGAVPEQELGVAEVIRVQTVYAGELTAPARESAPAPAAGYDHLGVAAEVRESKEREQTRERPDFSKRAWKKYYSRDGRDDGGKQ